MDDEMKTPESGQPGSEDSQGPPPEPEEDRQYEGWRPASIPPDPRKAAEEGEIGGPAVPGVEPTGGFAPERTLPPTPGGPTRGPFPGGAGGYPPQPPSYPPPGGAGPSQGPGSWAPPGVAPGFAPPPGGPGGFPGGYSRGPAAPPPPQGAYGPPPGQGYGPGPSAYGFPPPPPGYGPRPPMGGWRAAPPSPPRKASGLRIAIIIGVVIVAVLFLVNILAPSSISPISFGNKIGVLEVDGVIGEGSGYQAQTRELIDTLKSWAKDDSIKGVIVRINSPGGTVGATQELYDEIVRYRTETTRPVIASMGDLAASGGYYTAMACDEVVANPGTLTGSIGVILHFMNYEKLTDKIGLQFDVIKSGKYKDIGSGSRPMTEAEKKLLQGMIDNVYGQFVTAVTDGRGAAIRHLLAKEEDRKESAITHEELVDYVKKYADGRIFSGAQAKQLGFVDDLGSLQDAIRIIKKRAGITGEPNLISSRRPKGLLETLAGETKSLVRGYYPGQISLEYRFALP